MVSQGKRQQLPHSLWQVSMFLTKLHYTDTEIEVPCCIHFLHKNFSTTQTRDRRTILTDCMSARRIRFLPSHGHHMAAPQPVKFSCHHTRGTVPRKLDTSCIRLQQIARVSLDIHPALDVSEMEIQIQILHPRNTRGNDL